MTGSPEVATVTFFSVPPAAVTVMPVDGSADLTPLPGVIVTAGPAGDGFGGRRPPARWPWRPPSRCRSAPAYFTTVVVLVQAVSASASAATTRARDAAIARMPVMSPPFRRVRYPPAALV